MFPKDNDVRYNVEPIKVKRLLSPLILAVQYSYAIADEDITFTITIKQAEYFQGHSVNTKLFHFSDRLTLIPLHSV